MSKFLNLNMGFVRFVFAIVLQWENDLVIAECCMLFSPNSHNKKKKSQGENFTQLLGFEPISPEQALLQSIIIKT